MPSHGSTINHMSRLVASLHAGAAAVALAQPPAPVSVAVSLQVPEMAFERDLYKTRFEHEVAFRGAAIEVAWAAERVCDSTTEIEPFVLLSVYSLRRSLSDSHMAASCRWTRRPAAPAASRPVRSTPTPTCSGVRAIRAQRFLPMRC